jgi:hypothetical protein
VPVGGLRRLAAVAAAGTMSVAACSGAAPAPPASTPSTGRCPAAPRNQALVPYAPPPGVFTLMVPGRWARTRTPDGITFSDRFDSIRLEQIPYGSPSTVALVRSVELPGLRKATPGFRLRRLDTVRLPAGQAIRVEYAETVSDRPSGPAVERDVQRYELWHADQRMTLTLASPCEADAAPLWRRVTGSFRWRR